jgi:hypothetical protein
MAEARGRFPDYDVLAKRETPSWNETTRRVVEKRLALAPDRHRFFDGVEWRTLEALCDAIVPQPRGRAPVPVAAMIDEKMAKDARDGFRLASLPPMRETWRRGLAAIAEEARLRFGMEFADLAAGQQDQVLRAIHSGEVRSALWRELPPTAFFNQRLMHDVVGCYYAHPSAWSEIGFGGPAAPRGYVRMGFDRRDPWEAAERADV